MLKSGLLLREWRMNPGSVVTILEAGRLRAVTGDRTCYDEVMMLNLHDLKAHIFGSTRFSVPCRDAVGSL
jgi:hypothetical protein